MTEKKPTYSELKLELDELLILMQADDVSVEDAMKHYERGMELIKDLEKHLIDAENKVTKLKQRFE